MNEDLLRKLLLFVVLCLVQVLVLNHIHLFGCATPLLCIYFPITLQRNYPRWASLLWGFFLGLLLDIFANTPGVAAASMTLMAFLQPYILDPFLPREAADDFKPTITSLGFGPYSVYAGLFCLMYALVFFSLDMFSFFNILQWCENVGGSFLLTFLLIMVIDNVRNR